MPFTRIHCSDDSRRNPTFQTERFCCELSSANDAPRLRRAQQPWADAWWKAPFVGSSPELPSTFTCGISARGAGILRTPTGMEPLVRLA